LNSSYSNNVMMGTENWNFRLVNRKEGNIEKKITR